MSEIEIGMAISGATIGFLFGFLTGDATCSAWWRRKLIEREHAQFNRITGKWEWNDDR